MRGVVLVFVTVALAACTHMEFRRGTDVASLDSDEYRQCHSQALRESTRYSAFQTFYPNPIVVRDSAGRAHVIHQAWWRTDQLMIEHSSLMRCLADLGFKLVPIAEPPTPAAANPASPVAP